MKYYKVWLNKELWNSEKPFTTSWDYEMIGDVLRAEFDEYLTKYKADRKIITGGSRNILTQKVLDEFMLRKQINLTDAPGGGLVSVFVLKTDEKKIIDERCKVSLASRYEKKKVTNSDKTESEYLGFMEFEFYKQIGEDAVVIEAPKGKDVDFMAGIEAGDSEGEVVEKKEEKKEEVISTGTIFKCEKCGKEFPERRKYTGHMSWHRIQDNRAKVLEDLK